MKPLYGPFHRSGKPGGPGCPLAALDIEVCDPGGPRQAAQLLDAGEHASELEMLRTVASGLGVVWGQDEFGWWAVTKKQEFPTWAVTRQDDHGNSFLMAANLTESQARYLVAEFEAKGHKQTYFAEDQAIRDRTETSSAA